MRLAQPGLDVILRIEVLLFRVEFHEFQEAQWSLKLKVTMRRLKSPPQFHTKGKANYARHLVFFEFNEEGGAAKKVVIFSLPYSLGRLISGKPVPKVPTIRSPRESEQHLASFPHLTLKQISDSPPLPSSQNQTGRGEKKK